MAQAPQSKHSGSPAPVRPVKLEKPEIDIERRPDGTMLTRLYTMELEGSAKPAMVAEMLSLIVG